MQENRDLIIYLGNKLSKHGRTPTNVETLGVQLSEHVKIITASDKRNPLCRLANALWLVWTHRNKVQKVLVDTYSTWNFFFALSVAFLCYRLRIAYIPILHGGNLPFRLDHSPRRSRFLFNHSFVNVSPSGYLMHEFKKRGFNNVILIPNNIEIEKYSFKKRVSIRPRLLWVRAFDHTYNPYMAIEVVRLLRIHYRDALLSMVGPDKDGSLARTRQLVDELKLGDSVTFAGKLEKHEWLSLSANYDVFISTSRFDNAPVSVIEAMALGLPVVATNVGGIPFLIEDGHDGLISPPNDPEEMAKKVMMLLTDSQLAQSIADCARKKVEQFGWSKVKDKWLDLLKQDIDP